MSTHWSEVAATEPSPSINNERHHLLTMDELAAHGCRQLHDTPSLLGNEPLRDCALSAPVPVHETDSHGPGSPLRVLCFVRTDMRACVQRYFFTETTDDDDASHPARNARPTEERVY